MKPINLTAVVVLILSAAGVCRADPPLATMDDLNQMYEAKQYRVCLQQIARLMRPGNLGDQKFALLLLRGDCLLQLRDGATAKESYRAAEKSGNPDQVAEGRAMNYLISNSPGLQYTPRNGGAPIPKSVPIVPPASPETGAQIPLTRLNAPDVRRL